MPGIERFTDLVIWQKSISLARLIYEVSAQFPADERFGLIAQIRRAVISVSSNIAEGHSRQGREFANFLSIARGSLAEVESQLWVSIELGYSSRETLQTVLDEIDSIQRMTASLLRKLRDRK
jgi:four helix bundle protein